MRNGLHAHAFFIALSNIIGIVAKVILNYSVFTVQAY
jgi:hypothetical protein